MEYNGEFKYQLISIIPIILPYILPYILLYITIYLYLEIEV